MIDQYGAEIDILMQKGEMPNSANVFDAAEVLEQSKDIIVKPEGKA